MERGYVVMPIAPTSAMPLKLDAPGLHEGMYLPLPQLVPVPDSSLPNVVFVHMRQFYRMQQRRLEKADGDFHFSISIRKERRTRTLKSHALLKEGAKKRKRVTKDAAGEGMAQASSERAGTFAARAGGAASDSAVQEGQAAHGEQPQRKKIGRPRKNPVVQKPEKSASQRDCGLCKYCLDKVTFGGSGKLKRKCQEVRKAERLAKVDKAAHAPGEELLQGAMHEGRAVFPHPLLAQGASASSVNQPPLPQPPLHSSQPRCLLSRLAPPPFPGGAPPSRRSTLAPPPTASTSAAHTPKTPQTPQTPPAS